MNASLEGQSRPADKTFLNICCIDGNHFLLPTTADINVVAFMSGIKASGFVGTADWFVIYDRIMWVSKLVYREHPENAMASVFGMVKQ